MNNFLSVIFEEEEGGNYSFTGTIKDFINYQPLMIWILILLTMRTKTYNDLNHVLSHNSKSENENIFLHLY